MGGRTRSSGAGSPRLPGLHLPPFLQSAGPWQGKKRMLQYCLEYTCFVLPMQYLERKAGEKLYHRGDQDKERVGEERDEHEDEDKHNEQAVPFYPLRELPILHLC